MNSKRQLVRNQTVRDLKHGGYRCEIELGK